NFSFKFSKPSGRHVVTLENISKSYPNLEILKDTDALIEKGDKIALIGANGKGNRHYYASLQMPIKNTLEKAPKYIMCRKPSLHSTNWKPYIWKTAFYRKWSLSHLSIPKLKSVLFWVVSYSQAMTCSKR